MNQDIIQQIREKNDIVDIVGERIPLVARGKNFFGVCPFHDDSNPSLCVSREKQIYTCFSCHATGNVFTFLMNYEHKEFPEVVKELGDRVGIMVSSVSSRKTNNKYNDWYQIYDLANKYYQNNLMTSAGKSAREYLKNRGITASLIKEFELGWSLEERSTLTDLLVKKGYSYDLLNQVGLSANDYDIFHQRLMFPLHDLSGKVIGFSGRIIRDSDQNKYLNTKETDLFKKGKLLYHYHIAKDAARIKKCVLIMEGFMDIIRASSIDVKNTVATMGTALTRDHVQDIKRLSNTIILCFDGDEAGEKATLSAGELFLENGIETKVIRLPREDDPDSYILHYGKDSFLRLIEQAEYYSDYKIKALRSHVNFDSSEEKANYIHQVLEQMVKIEDPIRLEIVLKDLAKNYEIGYNTLEKSFQELKAKQGKKQEIVPRKQTTSEKEDKYTKASEAILYYMIYHPWVISETEKAHLVFPNEIYRQLENEIVFFYHQNGSFSIADFYTYLASKEELLTVLSRILMREDLAKEPSKEELFDHFQVMMQYCDRQKAKKIQKKLEEYADPLEQARIAQEIVQLRIGENKNGRRD